MVNTVSLADQCPAYGTLHNWTPGVKFETYLSYAFEIKQCIFTLNLFKHILLLEHLSNSCVLYS